MGRVGRERERERERERVGKWEGRLDLDICPVPSF